MEFIHFFLYSSSKQSYIGPSVDLACDNMRLLFSSVEEIVPTIPSQVQVAHGVLQVDVGRSLEEDVFGHVIAAQLGTACT